MRPCAVNVFVVLLWSVVLIWLHMSHINAIAAEAGSQRCGPMRVPALCLIPGTPMKISQLNHDDEIFLHQIFIFDSPCAL